MDKCARKTILLVEDEVIVSLCETRVIRGFGYDVVAVRTGEAAVDLVRGGAKVDLVLMDIDLGNGIDGPEAARRILDSRSLPIVFMTGHSEKSHVDKVREITRYGCVAKNSSDFVLQESIEMALELFDANERLRGERNELEKKRSELEASEERASLLLEEKDALLKELGHRVKNSMSNLISLLSLQAGSTSDARVSDALIYARSRIQCMEVLFNKLSILEKNPFILAREYFDEILPEIFQQLTPPCPITLQSEIDDVLLPADYFFPIGIMANELITNAVKHAFPDRSRGTIGIGFRVGQDSVCVLAIKDDGVGIRKPLPRSTREGFGALLVETMSRQLHGKVEVKRDSGTDFSISFPVERFMRAPPAPAASA